MYGATETLPQLFQKKTESFTLEDVPSPKHDLSGVNLKLKGPPSHDITRKYTSGCNEGDVSRKEVSHLLSDAVITILTEALGKEGLPLAPSASMWGSHNTGHLKQLASTAKKQRVMNADTQLFLSFSLHCRSKARGWFHP